VILRRPLNGLEPRTAREATSDPYDWWEAPPPHPTVGRSSLLLLGIIAIALLLLIAMRILSAHGGN
jgi:hypothetical protein